MRPTLQTIRETKSFEELKPAIVFLCDHMGKMTYGEFHAFQRTIEIQAEKLGVSRETLNTFAENYQTYGETK